MCAIGCHRKNCCDSCNSKFFLFLFLIQQNEDYFLFGKIYEFFGFSKVDSTVGGGGSPDTNAYLRTKMKVSVFENGQFSGHLIFDKKTFFRRKKFFTQINKNFVFLKKNNVHLFEKKPFFWKCFFENFFFRISKTFLPTKLLSKFFFNFFEKTFPKKRFFFKKMNIVFFQKNKVLVYRGKKIFFSEKKVFL